MKEYFDELTITQEPDYLLDTCFFVDVFEKGHAKRLEEFCTNNNVAISSFNAEEFLHMHHHLSGEMNHHIRNFLKGKVLGLVNVDVHPGNPESERAYVSAYDILKVIPDPSDAVLFVLALDKKSDILTRDKHHLFTAAAENFIENDWHNIRVLNDFPKD